MIGFAATEGDSNVTVFGLVPSGAVKVELQWETGASLMFDRVFTRPNMGLAVFIGVVEEAEIAERTARTPGIPAVMVADSDATTADPAASIESAGYGTSCGTMSFGDYSGPIASELFITPVPLIVGSDTIDENPEVLTCEDPEYPNQGEIVTDLEIHASPVAALEAFLAQVNSDEVALDEYGYTEFAKPDGTILFGHRYDYGFGIVISAIPVDGGWTIDRWEAAGC